MKKKFSKAWIRSTQVRKQRKYRKNAPLHIARKFLRSLLSQELRKKYNHRNLAVRKGDTVKVLRGEFKGKTGKVERVSIVYRKVYLDSISRTKKDGNKVAVAFDASKLMITALEIDDKRRKAILERK